MSYRDPLSAIVHVPLGDSLGESMLKFRVWLDGQKIRSAGFKTSVGAKGYTYTIGFFSIEDADRFRGQFR